MNNIINDNINKSPNVFHWSNAEKTIFNKMNKKYDNIFPVPNWLDFLEIFKKNNILIKNCFDYSLKNIAKEMYNNKFIKTIWKDRYSY